MKVLRYAYLQYLYPKLVILLHLIKAYLIWSTHINYLGPEECVDKEMLFTKFLAHVYLRMRLTHQYLSCSILRNNLYEMICPNESVYSSIILE